MEKKLPVWSSEVIRRMAQLLTGHKGSESLNRFAKQLVIGAAREKGFVDKQNDDMSEVYDLPYVRLGHFNVLTRFAFESESGRLSWDFGSGVSEGRRLQGYAPAKGRQSQWVGDGAKKIWEEHNITGVVLVGFTSGDVTFYHIGRDEFIALNSDRLTYKSNSDSLTKWRKAWDDLVFQPTFSSLMG